MSSDYHMLQVAKHCRVCGCKLGRVTYQCSKYKDQLCKHYELSVERDQEGVHPVAFCNNCWAKMRKLDKAASSGAVARTHLLETPFSWEEHQDDACMCM